MTVKPAADPRVTEFAHTALILDADADLPARLGPELRRSTAIFDEVVLVVGAGTRTALAGAVAELPGDAVSWREPAEFYQRLGCAYESFRSYLADLHRAGRRAHVIAEPDLTSNVDPRFHAGRAAAYLAYEAVCNDAYAIGGSAVTCIWDSRDHAGAVIDAVRATHALLLTADGPVSSPSYLPPQRYLTERHQVPMPPAPARPDHDVTLHDVGGLRGLRTALTAWAAEHGFAAEAAEDVLVAVTEVATNGLRHGEGTVRVRAWHHGDTLIVQCDDAGGRPIPAAAGYHRPRPFAAVGGRGLWLARQLADVVTVSSAPGRTAVCLQFPRRLMQPSS